MQIKAKKSQIQFGIITPLFAFALFLMIGLVLFIIGLDSVILTRSAHELRMRLEQACEYAARDAVIQQRAYSNGGMAKYLARTSGTYPLEDLNGDLFIPVVPPVFVNQSPTNAALPNTDCTGLTDCGYEYGANTNRLNCVCSKRTGGSDPLEFKDFTSANVDQDYDAGNYVGCTATATVKRFFLPTSTISASAAFWSIPYGLQPLRDSGDQPPTITVAIAPQVESLDALSYTPPYFDPQVIEDEAAASKYYNNITSNSNRPYYQVTLSGVNGTLAEPEYDLRYSGASADTPLRRRQLGATCESLPVLVRQRLSSALLELLGRNGLTRGKTQLLVTNPESLPSTFIPPTLVTPTGDIAARNSFIPLMQTSIKYKSGIPYIYSAALDAQHWLRPFYDDGAQLDNHTIAADARARSEYEALIARLPSMCYHSDNADRMRAGLQNASFDNSTYEPNSVYGRVNSLWSSSYIPTLDGSNWVYQDHLKNNLAQAAPTQVKLKPSEIASVLGASVRCPYPTQHTSYRPCPVGALPNFHADLGGLIRAWRGNGGFQPLQNGTVLNTSDANVAPGQNNTMVVFLQDVNTATLNTASNEIGFDAGGFSPTGPITLVYIPTDIAKADDFTLQSLSQQFKTNLCAPTFQPDGRRGNTLIPIIPKEVARSAFGDKGASCLIGLSACFDQPGSSQADLDAVYNCLLGLPNGREAEEFVLSSIYQGNLMRPVRRL